MRINQKLALVAALSLAACTDSPTAPAAGGRGGVAAALPPTHANVWTSGPPRMSTAPSMSLSGVVPCGAGATSALVHGGAQVGTVEVVNGPSAVYVTFRTADEWFVSNSLLSISPSTYGIPTDGSGRATPWAFPRQASLWPVVQEHTVTIPYAEYSVGAGESLAIAAVAGLVHPVTDDWNGAWEWLLLWGSGTPVHPSYPAETYGSFTVSRCSDGGPTLARRGAIAITFDDGWSSTHDVAFPILRARGLVGNAAVNPVAVEGRWTGYMHLPQIESLDEAGWSIISHSWSHPDLTTLTDAQLERELAEPKKWLELHGFRGSNVFAVPFHSWGERERAAIRRHYDAARGLTVNQFWPDSIVKWPAADPYAITGYEPEYAPFTSEVGREKVRAYLERVTREGRFIDLFFHQVQPQQAGAFGQLMDIVAEYRPVVRPYHELFP